MTIMRSRSFSPCVPHMHLCTRVTLDFGFDDLNDENSYDPEGAKAILEEAGYKDTDGDGFVKHRTEIL